MIVNKEALSVAHNEVAVARVHLGMATRAAAEGSVLSILIWVVELSALMWVAV